LKPHIVQPKTYTLEHFQTLQRGPYFLAAADKLGARSFLTAIATMTHDLLAVVSLHMCVMPAVAGRDQGSQYLQSSL